MAGKLIFIHGVSSSGKSTIGKMLNTLLENSNWIDQDTFYNESKPRVTFVNDTENRTYTGSNWDCIKAINFESLKDAVTMSMSMHDYTIVTGFALREKEISPSVADYSFLLNFEGTESEIVNAISENRKISKKFVDTYTQEKDYWMVRKIVYPFYVETLNKIQKSTNICVYRNRERVDVTTITNEILAVIGCAF